MLRPLTIIPMLIAAHSPAPESHATGRCFEWSIAAPIVKKEGLATVEKLTRLAHIKRVGDVLRAKLCEEQGAFSYRLVVRDPKGRLRILMVDARHPFER